jgi:hypothetical protein
MYCRIGRVEPFGPLPPLKAMNIWSNTLSDASTCSTVMSTVVARSCGSVIDHSRRQAPAPSRAAASYIWSGMACSADRYSRKLNPTVHHRVSSAIDHIATFGSVSQPTFSRPSRSSQ